MLLWVVVVIASSQPTTAQTITDGDTIKLHGATYRIYGIDAPEMKQDCPDGWPAGRLAATHLQSLIAGRSVTCQAKDRDRYGRTVAVCFGGGIDLGERMVQDGFAWAFTQYSQDYVGQERQARADRRGVHAHGCAAAWEWRAAQKK